MEECISNHQFLLSENYIVQPVENISCTIIDYDKFDMTHLIHSGQLSLGTPVIQLAEIHSSSKCRPLHPLEEEIQKDCELKQQQETLAKVQPSVIHSPIQTQQHQYFENSLQNNVASTCQDNHEVMDFDTSCSTRESICTDKILKIQHHEEEETLCNVSPSDKQMIFEKKQLIVVANNSMLLNVGLKESRDLEKNTTNDENYKGKFTNYTDNVDSPSLNLKKQIEEKETTAESDSENEETDLQPVCDYEPDPDGTIEASPEQNEKPNKCYMCFKSFRQKKNMYAHIRKIHSTQPKIEGGILCPLCKMHALRQEHLRTHLSTLHAIPIEKEEKLFCSMEDFFTWKETIEKDTFSFYVSKSSSKLLSNNQQKTYYKCHRSGNHGSLKNENRKKKSKLHGSNKIGATCPAAMEVTENVQGINVTFWKTHVGHGNDLVHLVSSKEEKSKIMDYVASGFSWNKIIEISKEGAKASCLSSKVTSVSKQDSRSVKQIHQTKSSGDLFGKRKINQGRKPVKETTLRYASQSSVLERADVLINLLETTDIRPEFRPKVCLMIDNLISTIKRRSIKSCKKEIVNQERKDWIKKSHRRIVNEKEKERKSK